MIVMTRAERRSLENQTVIMGTLAVLMDFVKINVAELRVVGGLQRVRLTDALAATRTMTESGAVPFAASTEPAMPCPGDASPMRSSVETDEPSGALREANANREYLRKQRRDNFTPCAQCDCATVCSELDSCGRGQ